MKIVQVRKNAFLFLGALSFLSLLLSGCLKEAQNTTSPPKTFLSLMHLAPRSPAVEVYFNNSKASSAINPGTIAASYSAVDPGMFSISFKKAGGDSVVASLGTNFYDSLRFYTLLLYNVDSFRVAAVKINDDFSTLTSDKTFYRFFHMSPDLGPVDLYFESNIIESYRQFADNTSSDYYNQFQPLTPNSYNIYAKKAGSDSVIASLPSVIMDPGFPYTFYLRGIKGGTGINAIGLDYLKATD